MSVFERYSLNSDSLDRGLSCDICVTSCMSKTCSWGYLVRGLLLLNQAKSRMRRCFRVEVCTESSIHVSPTGEISYFHRRFHPNHRAGDRSQHRHLQRHERRAPTFSSGPESPTARLFSFEKPASEHLTNGLR